MAFKNQVLFFLVTSHLKVPLADEKTEAPVGSIESSVHSFEGSGAGSFATTLRQLSGEHRNTEHPSDDDFPLCRPLKKYCYATQVLYDKNKYRSICLAFLNGSGRDFLVSSFLFSFSLSFFDLLHHLSHPDLHLWQSPTCMFSSRIVHRSVTHMAVFFE